MAVFCINEPFFLFRKSHKKKDCKFITLFFNPQIKSKLYLPFFNTS